MKYLADTLISFIILLAFVENVKLNPKIFDKDLMLLRERRATYPRELGKFKTLPIKYKINKDVNASFVKEAIKIIKDESCITFQEVSSSKGSDIEFVLSKEHYYADSVGTLGLKLPLKIGIPKDFVRLGLAVHELLHALGLFHEHERPDRDEYITINKSNIEPRYISNFKEAGYFSKTTYGIKYDYGSILHYERESGHKENSDSNITITTKNEHYFFSIGQTTYPSFLDTKLLNRRYCNEKCKDKEKLHCYYGGYANPKKCNECKCPTFYEPPFCKFVKNSSPECGKKINKASKNAKTLKMEGIHDCHYIIRAKENQTVEITIKKANSELTPICQPGSGLNIKFLKNKALSPVCFCGETTNYVLKSEGSEVVLRYIGKLANDSFELDYRSIENNV
uniref:Metalloendopeptidase n=1 Tax=Strongyloides stercoralis TaxID=6248 RepID=A0A0K0E400_STRER